MCLVQLQIQLSYSNAPQNLLQLIILFKTYLFSSTFSWNSLKIRDTYYLTAI